MAHFDTHMSMQHRVDAVCKKCNFLLRRIKSTKQYTTKRVCHSFVTALVISNLVYCNTLLLDLTAYHMTHLQKMHHKAAHLVVLTPVSADITPVVVDLHCLSVMQRIKIHDLLNPRIRNPSLRQLYDHLQLTVPPVLKSIGRRGF